MDQIKPIQGLRGLAVLLVILFHIHPNYSFGFIGVDIFFIISGFVISKSLINSKDLNGQISLKNFYIKRFFRLYPSLIFFFIFSSLILITLSIPTNIGNFIRTGLFSLFGISNFYLIRLKNDYFNEEELNPFTHTWSLGIEEQFYLFFPLIIFLFNKKRLNALLTILFIVSFYFFLFVNHEIYGNFFFTLVRVWELVLGAILFINFAKIEKIKKGKIFNFLVILIFFSLFFVESIKLKIVLATIFSILVISGINTNFIKKLFSNIFLFKVGEISYSLYLFHLPIIYVSKLYFYSYDFYIISLILIFLISYLNYLLIEDPFRKNVELKNLLSQKLQYLLILPLLIGPLLIYKDNYKKIIFFDRHFEDDIRKINYPIKSLKFIDNVNKNDLTCENENLVKLSILKKKCFKNNNSNNLIYLYGDSRAWHVTNLFEKINKDFIFHFKPNSSFKYPIFDDTDKSTNIIMDNLKKLSQDYKDISLVVSFHHRLAKDRYGKRYNKNDYLKNQKEKYILFNSSLPKNVKLLILHDTPTPNLSNKDCSTKKNIRLSIFSKNLNETNCDYSYFQFKKKNSDVINLLNQLGNLDNIHIVNINDFVCKNEICNFFYKGYPIIYDRTHFNKKFIDDNKKEILKRFNIN